MDPKEIKANVAIVIAAEHDVSTKIGTSPLEMAKPRSVVWALVRFTGVVGNGGSQYFFEADWPYQLTYSFFIEALTYVGAKEEADILAHAVASFPFPEPHRNTLARNKYMDDCRARDGEFKTEFDQLTDKLYDLSHQTDVKMVAYIRANIEFFPTAKQLIAG